MITNAFRWWPQVLSALVALTIALPTSAADIPANDGFVTDAAGILSLEEDVALESILTDYQRETSNEIAVLIVRSLSGADIAQVATDVGRSWGVGSEKNNGILILVSYDDREIFIAVGYGLEGAVPDIVAKGIIDEDLAPHFREAEYAAGLTSAIDSLKKHIGGEYTADRYSTEDSSAGVFSWILFFVFIGLDWLGALLGRTKSWWLGGVFGAAFGIILTILYSWWVSIPVLVLIGLLFDYIVSKKGFGTGRGPTGRSGGWRGGGTSSGGGSGFSGFGGGSFGGGGARGKW